MTLLGDLLDITDPSLTKNKITVGLRECRNESFGCGAQGSREPPGRAGLRKALNPGAACGSYQLPHILEGVCGTWVGPSTLLFVTS